MNNLNIIKPKQVQNIIDKFCYTIGMIPTSYKLSLSYEEQILSIGKYLEDTVYPAINNNAEALTELQNLFIDLKNYVDNYFDNLDVQNEINNKLDNMAESGELTEIIAQYLQLQGLLCYNTLNDMKNATNIAEGSFTKTYGRNEYNDGEGEFYKIRQILNTDIVDNINIIALINYPNLVAELITSNDIQTVYENEMPSTPRNNTIYNIIESENNINITELPKSEFELLQDNLKYINENENSNIFKIGTYNIENDNVPYTEGITGLEKQNILKHLLNKFGCSICGLNETFNGFLYPANKMYNTEFLSNVRFGQTMTSLTNLFYGNTISSYYNPVASSSQIFTNRGSSNEPKGFIKNVYSINNKLISFYCVHFAFEDATIIQQQIDELFSIVNSDVNPYKIIVGDFNFDLLNSNTMLSQFITAGFKQANKGNFVTFPSSGLAIDEIMVSSNINILNAEVPTLLQNENISDHLPLVAEIQLI